MTGRTIMARDRWFTGHRASQDRTALARTEHLYRTDPAYRAEHDAHVARHDFRARVLRRYGALLGAAMRRGELSTEEAFRLVFAAQERTARWVS
jgi:hypothetical protein